MENVDMQLAQDAIDAMNYLGVEICRQSVLEDAVESLKKTDPDNAKWLDEFFTEDQKELVELLEGQVQSLLVHMVECHGFTFDPYGYHDEIEEALTKFDGDPNDK